MLSNVDREYSLTFSGWRGDDDLEEAFSTQIPKSLYKKGTTRWFLLDDNLDPCDAYEIMETGGATLDISEVYFNNGVQDITMSEASRYEYLSYPNKSQIGRPTIYYVDYLRTPSLYIWQTPSSMYNLIMYSGQSSIETLENYTQGIDIPPYFYTPLIYGLASMLATQYAPEKEEGLKIRYGETLNAAVINNTAEVPLKLEVYGN